jgi:hypothetical protein
MTTKSVNTEKRAKPTGPWLRISGAFSYLTYILSDRRDLTVAIAPEAGWGSPAAMLPPTASIEIDAKWWPENFSPSAAFPRDPRDWKNYPAIIGLLAHEVAHGDESDWMYEVKKKWRTLTDDQKHALGAAELLEESRVEHKHIQYRPQDTPWLQASASTIALSEIMGHPLDSVKAASRVAAIILGRRDGGSILDSPEVDAVEEAVINGLIKEGEDRAAGVKLLLQLEEIWKQFLATDSEDTDEFMRLGKEWYDLTQDDGNDDEGQSGEMSKEMQEALENLGNAIMEQASGSKEMSDLLKKLAAAVDRKTSDAEKRDQAKKDAAQVFHDDGGRPTGRYKTFYGWREPTVPERRLGRKTADDILKAYIREKAVVTTSSDRPPGRLNPRAAMQGQAQRAMGMYPTVEPFTRKDRIHTNSPPLKVGILVDTSDSQSEPAQASASGAYSLAAAIKSIPDGQVALVTFGDRAKKILGPWEKLPGVPRLEGGGGTGHFKRGLRALEGELHLMRTGAARLLVIVTDGMLNHDEYFGRDEMIKRYLDAGVHVLWVVTGSQMYFSDESNIGGNGKAWYGSEEWFIPEIRHPLYKVARPYLDHDQIPKMITAEAVRTLKETQ